MRSTACRRNAQSAYGRRRLAPVPTDRYSMPLAIAAANAAQTPAAPRFTKLPPARARSRGALAGALGLVLGGTLDEQLVALEAAVLVAAERHDVGRHLEVGGLHAVVHHFHHLALGVAQMEEHGAAVAVGDDVLVGELAVHLHVAAILARVGEGAVGRERLVEGRDAEPHEPDQGDQAQDVFPALCFHFFSIFRSERSMRTRYAKSAPQ